MALHEGVPRRKSKWRILWYPVIGVVLLDLIYQVLISWRQSSLIARAQPAFLILAVINQLAIYVMLIPVMQQFYAAAQIRISAKRTFSLLAMGLAFARIIPLGDYLVWRGGFRKRRGGVSATTQWFVMYYTWMLGALIALFFITETMAAILHPAAHVQTLVGYLKYLPMSVTVIVVIAILATRSAWVREKLRRLVFDKLGSQAISPIGIIRDRKLGPNILGIFTFASMGNWIMEGYTLYLCLRALGLNVPISITIFGFTFARLFSLIPILPGGIGQIEAGTALFFAAYGYPFAPVLTATVLYRLITYWPALLIGAGSYIATNRSEARLNETAKSPVFASQIHRRRGHSAT